MKTIDLTVSKLCDEIDYLKEEVEYWKQKFEAERGENNTLLKERMEEAQKGVATALMLCMSVKDAPDGSLVIDKEDRKELANHFNKQQ